MLSSFFWRTTSFFPSKKYFPPLYLFHYLKCLCKFGIYHLCTDFTLSLHTFAHEQIWCKFIVSSSSCQNRPELPGVTVTSNCLYVCYIELWKAEKPSPCYNYIVLHIFLLKFNVPLLRFIPFLLFVKSCPVRCAEDHLRKGANYV